MCIRDRYYLADCYELTGRTASAWVNFLEVATEAKATGEGAKETKARERAAALAPKLVRLRIVVAASAPGMVVTRNDEVVGSAQFGTPVPVDPASYAIRARAPGKQPWSTTIEAREHGSTIEVHVPALIDAPSEPASGPKPVEPSPPPKTDVEAPAPTNTTAPASTAAVSAPERDVPPTRDGTRAALIYGGAAVAGVGFVVGTISGLIASSNASTVKDGCPDGRCPPALHDDLDRAQTFGTVSTISFIGAGVGAALFGVGLFMPKPVRTEARGTVQPVVGAGFFGMQGTF